MEWIIAYLNDDVRAEVESLTEDLRAKFRRIVELIRSKSLEQVHEPYIRHLEDKLWEMRLTGGIISLGLFMSPRAAGGSLSCMP